MNSLAMTIMNHKYAHDIGGRKETWEDIAWRVATHVVAPLLPEYTEAAYEIIRDRLFIPGGRYLYAAGRKFHQVNNCLLLNVEDSAEAWGSLMNRTTQGLMRGAGIGVVYSALREKGARISGLGGTSTGPLALMNMVNEGGRFVMQGGSRRSAIWAGLHWNHPDIWDFIRAKDWSDDIYAMKEKDFNFPAPLDMTNISVILDDEFFEALHVYNHPMFGHATQVYDMVVAKMRATGEPGFSIDVGENAGEHLRNACTEVTSRDDNDVCNLGSINLARIDSLKEMEWVTQTATAFLLCGSVYSKVPYPEVAATRDKNRRLGLGLMGMHEWLLKRDYEYGPNRDLAQWLKAYEVESDYAARAFSERLSVSRPVKVRAVAPAGTISILGETTSGIEPIYATAYRRRYLKGTDWNESYVLDAAAERLAKQGIDPATIETAYDLGHTSEGLERRIQFQVFVQGYVDHGISSTINLPALGQGVSSMDLGTVLLPYLSRLRGITTYPDGARGGQPLTPVPWDEVQQAAGAMEYANEVACGDGACSI